MPIARDEHNFRDVGGPGNLHVQELSPAERKASLDAQEQEDAEVAETLKESLASPVVGEKILDTHIDVAVARASVIETPAQKRDRQLGYVTVNGVQMHISEAKRRAAQNEPDYEGGPTPEETAAFMREVEEESEESFWNDE